MDGFKTKSLAMEATHPILGTTLIDESDVNWEELEVEGFSRIELAYVVWSLNLSSDFLIKLIILEVHVRVIISHSSFGLISQHAMGLFHGSVWPWGREGIPRVSQQ